MTGCRFIHGDPKLPGWRFCNGPCAPDRPYCAAHWRKTHIPHGTAAERRECARMNILASSSAGRLAEEAHIIPPFGESRIPLARSLGSGRTPARRAAA